MKTFTVEIEERIIRSKTFQAEDADAARAQAKGEDAWTVKNGWSKPLQRHKDIHWVEESRPNVVDYFHANR